MTRTTRADDAAPGSEAEQPSFEALFERLTAVTAELEAGDLPLARSIELYEEGMLLARQCQQLLTSAEQRIETLREAYDGDDRGAPGLTPS